MRAPVTTELYVHAEPARIADAVLHWPRGGGVHLSVEGSWRPAPWTRSRDAWRRDLRWTRGRTAGVGSVDLVPVGDARTLLVLTLAPARGWPVRRTVTIADVTTLARALRAAVEDHAATPLAAVVPLPDRATRTVVALGSAPTAVGYSRP